MNYTILRKLRHERGLFTKHVSLRPWRVELIFGRPISMYRAAHHLRGKLSSKSPLSYV